MFFIFIKNMEKTDVRQKCVSLSIFSKKHKEMLTSNISAPFDLYCMKKDHKFSPFTKPILDLKPHLLINSILNEADVVNIIKTLQFDSNKNQLLLLEYLLKKDIVNQLHGTENNFLALIFLEAIDYAAQKDFTAFKLTCLLNIYISAHNYMKSNDWRQPKQIWDYFKEVLIRLTIEDSPDGQEVFSPDESYDILSHFHTIYMNNLPLIHILVFGVHRLRLVWPFN